MSYEHLTSMGTETQQAAAATEPAAVTAPVVNNSAQEQIRTYRYLQAVEATRTGDQGAMESLKLLVQEPEVVQTLRVCSELESGQRTPSFATPEDERRYQQLCMAARMAQETSEGKDPLRETLMGAMKVGALFGALGTVAAGFTIYSLYKKYKKFKSVTSEPVEAKEKE